MLHQWDQRACADARQIGWVRAGRVRRSGYIRRCDPNCPRPPIGQRDNDISRTSPRSLLQHLKPVSKKEMMRVGDRDVRHDPIQNRGILPCSAIQPLPTPSSIASCITLIGSPSRARACAKPPPSVRSLTTSPPTDLMTTSSREPASAGGRDHRNPWPASIRTGGRLRSESTADFVEMRTEIEGMPDFVGETHVT